MLKKNTGLLARPRGRTLMVKFQLSMFLSTQTSLHRHARKDHKIPHHMNKIKSAGYVLALSIIAAAHFGCSTNEPAVNTAAQAPTEPPFKNEEPERYQTYIIQTTPAETVRFFVARDGAKWRVDSAYGTPDQTTSLHTDKDYVLSFGPRAYSEYESSHGYDERPYIVEEITHGMINRRDNAVYEKTGDSEGTVKYRYLDDKGREAIITYDETKSIPTMKEVYSIKDGSKLLEASISLEGFTTDVDPSNFELPKDFKRVTPQEMRSILSKK